MPHLVISYAKQIEKDIDMAKLVKAVWDAADSTGLFNPKSIKVRALPVEFYLTADTDRPFVHIDAKLFEGRTADQKGGMTQTLFDAVLGQVTDDIAVSVEAIDMDKGTYLMR